MFSNVIGFGDSFIEGAEITEIIPDMEFVAPAIIAKNLNIPFYNFAKSGVGVLDIFRQIMEAEYKKILNKNSIVVISLPPVGRFDFFKDSKTSFTIDYPYHHAILTNQFNFPIDAGIENNPIYKKCKNFYYSLGNDIDMIETGDILHAMGIYAILKILSNYKTFIFCGYPPIIEDVKYENHIIKELEKNQVEFIKNGFTGWSNGKSYYIHTYGHPGKRAHLELAKLIEQKLII